MFVEEKALGESQEPSLDGFIGYLKTQNPADTYPWTNSTDCACARYLKSIDKYDEKWLHGHSDDTMHRLNRIAGGAWDPQKWGGAGGFSDSDWTNGGCLARAEKAKELA